MLELLELAEIQSGTVEALMAGGEIALDTRRASTAARELSRSPTAGSYYRRASKRPRSGRAA